MSRGAAAKELQILEKSDRLSDRGHVITSEDDVNVCVLRLEAPSAIQREIFVVADTTNNLLSVVVVSTLSIVRSEFFDR